MTRHHPKMRQVTGDEIMRQSSTRFDHLTLALIAALALLGGWLVALGPASAAPAGSLDSPAPQFFAIAFGDTVSDGVPAPGAGNLEEPGSVDIYTFDGAAGQEAIFDWLSGSNVLIGWALKAPGGGVLFDTFLQDRQVLLPSTGVYTLTVDGNQPDNTGTYSFRLLDVPAPQQFSISFGDTVAEGTPAPGAGELEAPGAVDVYTFDGAAGQEAIFDRLSGSNVMIGWHLQAPGGVMLFDTVLQDRQVTLPSTGAYTLTVDGNNIDSTGAYAFRLLEAPEAQLFAIAFGDTVSDGVPASGAGNLEAPGAVDIYNFDGAAGQEAVFDWLSGSNVMIGWALQAPGGAVLFDTVLQDQQVALPSTGVYTLTVDGNNIDSVGVYSFQLLEAAATQHFNISFGDTVADGVPAPGAGNLEAPGAVDIYNFDGAAGQVAIFDWLSGSNVTIGWALQAPGGAVLFDTFLQDRQLILTENGVYTLTVRGLGPDDFGPYSFALLEGDKRTYLPLVVR
jgi:hypothetical protein